MENAESGRVQGATDYGWLAAPTDSASIIIVQEEWLQVNLNPMSSLSQLALLQRLHQDQRSLSFVIRELFPVRNKNDRHPNS